MEKRLFRVVSCSDLDRCVSYSTLEKAEAKLYKLASEKGHDIVKTYTNSPKDYDWYNGYHPVKAWHNYVTKEGYCYVIVESNKGE